MPSGTRNSSRSTSPGCTGPRGSSVMPGSLVIIGNLNLFRVTAGPHKADPKLVIDPDRVLSGAGMLQRLEAITWRSSQVTQLPSGVQHHQLAPRHPDRIRGIPLAWILPEKDRLGIFVLEAPDRHPSRRLVTYHNVILSARFRAW